MFKRMNSKQKTHTRTRPLAALALALALCIQLAVPAFAAQPAPAARAAEPPEITEPDSSMDASEEADEPEAPKADAPVPGAEDLPPAEAEPQAEAGASSDELTPAAEGDITITNAPGNDWAAHTVGSIVTLPAGNTLTIADGVSGPADSTVIQVVGYSATTTRIIQESTGVLENLRVEVTAGGNTLYVKNLKIEKAADATSEFAALRFYDADVYPYDLQGTLQFEGECSFTAHGAKAPGLRAQKVVLQGLTDASTLTLFGADATETMKGGDGIYLMGSSDDPLVPALLIPEGSKGHVKGVGGSSAYHHSDYWSTGQGMYIQGWVDLYGTLEGVGGDYTGPVSSTSTRADGHTGIVVNGYSGTGPAYPNSKVRAGVTVTGIGGSAPITGERNDDSGGGNGINFDPVELEAGAHLLGTGGDGNTSCGTGVYLWEGVRTSDSSRITGIGGSGYNNSGIGVSIFMEKDHPLKGTIIARGGNSVQSEDSYGLELNAVRIDNPDRISGNPDIPWMLPGVIYEIDGTIMASSGAAEKPSYTQQYTGIYARFSKFGGYDDVEGHLRINPGAQILRDPELPENEHSTSIYFDDEEGSILEICQGAKVEAYALPAGTPWYTAEYLAGIYACDTLIIDGEVEAVGTGDNSGTSYSSRQNYQGSGLLAGVKLELGANAVVKAGGSSGAYFDGIPVQGFPVGVWQTYHEDPVATGITVASTAKVETPNGIPLYVLEMESPRTGATGTRVGIGNELGTYVGAWSGQVYSGFAMVPAGWYNAFEEDTFFSGYKASESDSNYTKYQVAPAYEVKPTQTGNKYSFDNVVGASGEYAVAPTSVTFDITQKKLAVGEGFQITPTITPANANRILSWSLYSYSPYTLNRGYVTLTEPLQYDQTLTGRSVLDSQKYASCKITSDDAPIVLTGIEVSPASASVPVNGTLQLTAAPKPSGATLPSVSWSVTGGSANVSVSSSGLVTGLKAGSATVKATAGSFSADCTVTVVGEPVELKSVTITPASAKLLLGASHTLQVTPNTGATLEGATIAWSVTASNPTNPGDPAVVALEGATNAASATLKATADGTATVQVVVTTAGGTPLTASCAVQVYTAVTGLSLSENALRMLPAAAGSPAPTATLAATIAPASAEADLVWHSSNSRVVAVAAGADGKTATLTAGAIGSAVVSVSTADGAFTASCAVTVGWAEGTLALDKGYLLLATTDSPVTLNIAATSADAAFPLGTPTDLTGANTAADVAISPAGDTLTITPKAAGTVYVRIGVPGNPALTAACKVVVYTPGGDLARRRIDPTTLTIYRLQEAPDLRIPLVLEDGGTPWKLTDATYAFAGSSAEALGAAFDILPHEDGQSLKLVKKAGFAALTAAKYTATITVTPTGKAASAELIPDTLTIKLASGLPKLAATAITLESFGENRTADIVLTGMEGLSYTLDENPAKENANRKMREWLTLDKAAQTITVAAGAPKQSGTYHLTATLAGWGANAKVNVSLKVSITCTVPQLALDKTSVTVFETATKTTGAPLRLMPKAADATLAALGVENLEVVGTLSATEAKTYKNQAAYKVTGFNQSTGSFTLEATGGSYPAGKVLLGAKVAGSSWLVRVPVTVKVLKPGGTVKLAANATSVTLNQLLTPRQAFTFELTTNAPGYDVDWDKLSYTLKRGKTDVKDTDELDLDWGGSTLTVRTTDTTAANASYKLKITKTGLYLDKKGNPKDGSITLTIKTVKTTAQVGAKLAVSGKTDLTTGACAVVTAKFTNYQGGYTAQPTFTVVPPRGAPAAMKDAFDFEPVGGDGAGWRIVPKPGVVITPGGYKVSIAGGTGTLPGVASTPATAAAKFTVSATKPKVTQSAAKVTLYTADKASTASLSLTLPAGTAPVKKVEMKGYDASLYDFELTGGTLTIGFKQANFDAKKIKSKTLTFEVYLEGNLKPASTFKVSVTAKAFK